MMSNNLDENEDPNSVKCPICFTPRYLRPDIRFLINPECYHRMCESCVDRIFSHGPAQCPVAGCQRTLRHRGFRVPTFGDLQLEREIDIRKQVSAVFNRREDEFETLRDYNDYLNEVEDITFNLIYGMEVEETKKRMRNYAEENANTINENNKLASRELQAQRAVFEAEKYTSRQSLEKAFADDERERREKDRLRRQIVEQLAGGADAMAVAREGQRALQKPGQRAHARSGDVSMDVDNAGSFKFAGLRSRLGQDTTEDDVYDPFGGYDERHDWVTLPDVFDGWEAYLGKARKDHIYTAGGYDVREFYLRSMTEAWSGLGVFVGEECEERDQEKKRKRRRRIQDDDTKMEDTQIKAEGS